MVSTRVNPMMGNRLPVVMIVVILEIPFPAVISKYKHTYTIIRH